MRSPRHVIAALAAAMMLAQLWLAHRYFGFLTGDDVEVLAEAFRVALGFRYQAWDIRCLIVPDFLAAPPVRIATWLGVHDTRALIEAATLPFIALSGVTVVLVHKLALRWSDGDALAANVAAVLFAFHWIPLGFGGTVYPRTLATACVVGAALLLTRDDARSALFAGLLVGIAFADRFSELVFLVPLLVIARRRAWLVLVGASVAIALTAGVYDWLTWGEPFGSVIRFAKLTLVAPDFASRVKYQAPWWYVANLTRWCSPLLLPLIWIARRRAHWMFFVVPLLALSVIRHKELRYLQAIVPFVMIAAAIGAAVLWRTRRNLAIGMVAISVVWHLYGIRYFARKSMPAVVAARTLGADANVHVIVMSQLWAYGDRLYFTDRKHVRDVGTPPSAELPRALEGADAAALYESDLDDGVRATLARAGFTSAARYDDGPARAVIVFRRTGG